TIPEPITGNPGYLFAGQNGGFMGRSWDPQFFKCDPTQPDCQVESLKLRPDVPPLRLSGRRRLLGQIDDQARALERSGRLATYGALEQLAFDVLLSGPSRAAFDLQKESSGLRDRYGRNKFGQSLLLARRLIEAGVRFV